MVQISTIYLASFLQYKKFKSCTLKFQLVSWHWRQFGDMESNDKRKRKKWKFSDHKMHTFCIFITLSVFTYLCIV